jgi:hypothetical protein
MDKRLKEVCKLLLLVAVLLFAPIWIPIAVVVIATTILVVGGILAALAMVTFTILSFLLGVIGLPALLFSITVTAFAYFALTILKTIAEKIRRIMKPYIKGKKILFLDMFSFGTRLWKNEESDDKVLHVMKKTDSWGNIPCYADENEVETETSRSHIEQVSE